MDKLADLVQVAQGRIEFHIVSFSGVGRAPQTEEDAIKSCGALSPARLAFQDRHNRERSSWTFRQSASAHINRRPHSRGRSGGRLPRSPKGKHLHGSGILILYTLSWWPQLQGFIKDRGVDWIIQNHTPVALRSDQFLQQRGWR